MPNIIQSLKQIDSQVSRHKATLIVYLKNKNKQQQPTKNKNKKTDNSKNKKVKSAKFLEYHLFKINLERFPTKKLWQQTEFHPNPLQHF